MTPELGIIEGFFGKPYSWPDRTRLMRTVAAAGYGFYHYAPKADPFLRRQWREAHPPQERAALSDFGAACRDAHVRGFTGRSSAIGAHITGHAINPASQPRLSALPALTLTTSYRCGGDYDYGAASRAAAEHLFGDTLARMLVEDLAALQDTGLDRLGTRRDALRARYAAFDNPAAREVVDWLDGAYATTQDEVRTQ